MSIWTASAWPILLSAALKSTLVLAAAWCIAWILRHRSAAARHLVWTAAAAALVALPLLTVALPALRLRAANALLPADAGIVFQTTSALPAGAGAPAAQPPAALAHHASLPASAPLSSGKDALVLLWMAGLAAGLLQMLAASLVLWRTRRHAPISPDQSEADELAWRLGIPHPVQVLETPTGMPMTFGLLRPTILLPAEARAWNGERRHVVLLHELAHVLRGDSATHLLARAALALHWWNPLAWMAWREFLKERERAADDLVLGTGAPATDYAAHLLDIARGMQVRPSVAAAGVAMARRSQLEGRLLAILDGRTPRSSHSRAAAFAAAALAVALIAPLAAVRAQSQAEQNAPPPDVDATIRAANQQKNHEILDRAAVSYEQLRQYAEAQKLREASLSLAGQVSGEKSKDYVSALVNLGNLARRRGSFVQANAYYEQALALGPRPEVFPALMALGRDALLRTRGSSPSNPILPDAPLPDPAKALEYFTRARNLAANGNDLSTALTWMAQAHRAEPDGAGRADADSLYHGAMAAADPDSPEQALAQDFYAQFLKDQDRATEAAPFKARANTIRKNRINSTMRPPVVPASSVVRVGNGVKAPSLVYKVEPNYTEEARAAKYSGNVLLNVVVDVDGKPKDIEVVNALGLGLDEEAIQAVQQWRFKPGEKDGVPVPVLARIEVNFRLL